MRPTLPLARSLFAGAWLRSAGGSAAIQSIWPQDAASGGSLASQAYAYDAPADSAPAAADAAAAEIGEVDFDAAAANTVRLIGTVGGKRELRVFERGKLLPFAIGIKTDRRKPEETDWINVEVWGPLAERADQLLNGGDRVAVQGRLRVDRWEDRATGAKRTAFKIVASSISRVRRTPFAQQQPGSDDQQQGQQFYGGGGGGGSSFEEQAQAQVGGGASAAASAGPAPWDLPVAGSSPGGSGGQQQQQTAEELWMDYFENPDQWYDNRTNKRNPKAPDFKKKEGGRDAPALWLSGRSTPAWVEAELRRLDGAPGGQ